MRQLQLVLTFLCARTLSFSQSPAISTVPKIEAFLNFWDVTPRVDLLSEVEENEAYGAAKEGERYLVYFTKGRSVKLDLREHGKRFSLMWISFVRGEWSRTETVRGGQVVTLKPVGDEGSLALLLLAK